MYVKLEGLESKLTEIVPRENKFWAAIHHEESLIEMLKNVASSVETLSSNHRGSLLALASKKGNCPLKMTNDPVQDKTIALLKLVQ